MWSVAFKNDNPAFLHFLIMSRVPYVHFISGRCLKTWFSKFLVFFFFFFFFDDFEN